MLSEVGKQLNLSKKQQNVRFWLPLQALPQVLPTRPALPSLTARRTESIKCVYCDACVGVGVGGRTHMTGTSTQVL